MRGKLNNKMVSINFATNVLLVFFGLICGISSQNASDNYVKLKNEAETIEYTFVKSVEDFSQLHSAPLGPLAQNVGSDICYKGAIAMYTGINYASTLIIRGSNEEICQMYNTRVLNSVLLLGSSNFVHLFGEELTVGNPISYNNDVANITLSNTNSLIVVGEGLSATFYTLPNYGGASVCVSVGTNPEFIFNRIQSTTATFGFTTIRSFKFGCNSKKIIHP